MSSRRGQSDGSFRLAWHPKPGAARPMFTKSRYLLGPFQLADGRPLARLPLLHRDEVSAKTAHDARYLGQPFLGVSPKLSLRAKAALDLAKVHPCPSQRHGEIEEHFVTPTRVPFRASPDVLSPLDQHLVNTDLRNLGLAQHLDPRLQRNRYVLKPD